MEPSRFDDVAFRIIDEPEPSPRRRRGLGHATLALIAALLLAGSLAAGASALTSTAQAPTRSMPAAYSDDDGLPCPMGPGHAGLEPRN